MRSSQSLTPNQLNPSNTEPNNRTPSQILGKWSERHRYSDSKVLFSLFHWTPLHLDFSQAFPVGEHEVLISSNQKVKKKQGYMEFFIMGF